MNRVRTLSLISVALLFLALALPSGEASGQQGSLQEQLVGTWIYVSVDIVQPDGSRVPSYGPNPQGLASFDSNGRYILLTARAGLPKFASNNRMEGTPEENKAVVQGSIAHFGRYSVDEANKTVTFHIETSTFPNWTGTEQKRPFTVTGDELKWTTPASGGGLAEVVLRRAR
jgi:lipocalin-like protein